MKKINERTKKSWFTPALAGVALLCFIPAVWASGATENKGKEAEAL